MLFSDRVRYVHISALPLNAFPIFFILEKDVTMGLLFGYQQVTKNFSSKKVTIVTERL